LTTFPNPPNSAKNTPLRVVFLTLVFGNVVKQSFLLNVVLDKLGGNKANSVLFFGYIN